MRGSPYGKTQPDGEKVPQKHGVQEVVAKILVLRCAKMDVATREGGTQIVMH